MLKVINPATEETIRELEEDSPSQVAEKHARAVVAQKAWAKVALPNRLGVLKKFRDLVGEKKESLAEITTSEVGKPLSQSRNELGGLIARTDFFLEQTARTLADENVYDDPAGKMREVITHEPLGVIGNISAWNYPYFVGANVFVPGLLAGNAILYKPSEFSALTGLAIADLLHEAGVPRDVFVPVIGDGAVGAELVNQALAGIYFTGSYPTGQRINEAAAKRLMRVQLELGGKDPVYVADDVTDVKAAAEGIADGAFYNTGQSCCSVERIYVHEKVYEEFVAAFVATVKGFISGDPKDEKTYIGPITRPSHLAFLEKQVADATKKGAQLLTGGKRKGGTGYYFEPTVFRGVNHTMELMREETFGPLIGIQSVASDAEAIKLMNDTAYGLTAGVYSRGESRAKAILAEVNAGSVYWNCCDRVSPRLPWSGRGHSGVGCTLSHYGITAFTQPKGWHLRG
jgi:acyl-CoA reductase-like NAD-dependent aldehyde dehydrogenase